jgi:hypothetical protein
MPTVRFTGRILPAALNVSVANRPTFRWNADELGLEITFRVHIENGSIQIDCDLGKFEEAYVVPLSMRAHDIARASVDLIAFATGNGLTVMLEEFTDPTGTTTQLAPQQPSLAALVSAVKIGTPDFDKILQVVLAEPRLFLALRDLIEAISVPHRATVACVRAVRNLGPILGSSGSPDRSWLSLRENLQISRPYLQRITQYVQNPGGGDHAHISDARATDIVHGAWIIMNRILEYLRRGGQPLPVSEFPLLV